MIRLEGNALAGSMGAGAAPAQPSPARTGQFRGEQVLVKETASVLADAAEEISLHHAEKVESKRFAQRECRADQQHSALAQVEEIQRYLETVNAFDDPDKLAALVKRMQSSQSHPRELARQHARDPAHQYALLQHALQDGEAHGAPADALDELRDAIADLELAAGPQIRAGFASIGAASSFARTAREVQAFQATYQDVVLGDASLSQTLRLAVDRLGGADGENLARGLQGLILALGTDLAAARPSTDAARLQALIQDLYQLEVAATVLDNCRNLAATLAEKHATTGVRPVELMKELISVSGEKWVGATRFTGLAERMGVRDTGAQIAFFTGLKFMVKDLPVKVFSDADSRQTVINASQEALDAAIDKEEG